MRAAARNVAVDYRSLQRSTTNDLAILTPPGRKPILVAAYTMGGRGEDTARQAVLADIGRIVAARFA